MKTILVFFLFTQIAVASEIADLKKQRLDVLKEVVQITTAQYREGKIDFRMVAMSQNDYMNAFLDSTENREKRIEMLEEQVKMTKAIWDYTEQKFLFGMITALDVKWAKVLYLTSKIRLAYEKERK